jgi:hypothetical protein
MQIVIPSRNILLKIIEKKVLGQQLVLGHLICLLKVQMMRK